MYAKKNYSPKENSLPEENEHEIIYGMRDLLYCFALMVHIMVKIVLGILMIPMHIWAWSKKK